MESSSYATDLDPENVESNREPLIAQATVTPMNSGQQESSNFTTVLDPAEEGSPSIQDLPTAQAIAVDASIDPRNNDDAAVHSVLEAIVTVNRETRAQRHEEALRPQLRNLIEHETVHGYRSFELWQGDITEPGFPVDVLALSAFAGDYSPTSTSVIGALFLRHGINVGRVLEENCAYDFRDSLGVWVSQPLAEKHPFRRILGVELRGSHLEISETLRNVFALLAMMEAQGIETRTLALPVLGAGGQGFHPHGIMDALLPAAKGAIQRSLTLERVAFFGYTARDAEQLDAAMDEVLGRSRVVLPKNQPLIRDLRADIIAGLRIYRHKADDRHYALLDELEAVLRREVVRSFEIGILGRRLAEMIVDDLCKANNLPNKGGVLARQIDAIREAGIAEWIISYLHVLRHLGNESAHQSRAGECTPPFIGEADLVIGLFCIKRLWCFWSEYNLHEQGTPAR